MQYLPRNLSYWLSRIAEPSSEVRGADRYTARLISGISLILAIMAFLALPFLFFVVGYLRGVTPDLHSEPEWWLAIGMGSLVGVAYILSKTQYYRYSGSLLIAAFVVGTPAASLAFSPRIQFVNSILVYSVIPILLTDMFFSLRHVVAVTIILVAGEFLLGDVVGTPYRPLDAALIVPVQIMVSTTLLVARIHRDSLQALAEKKIKESARLERHRIAEEIHDAALQDILLVGRYLGVVRKRLTDSAADEKMTEYVQACETAIDRANTRLRGLLREARLANTVKEPLGSMIRDWLQLVKLWSDTRISLKLDLDDAVEEKLGNVGTKLALYYIVQEATINAIRHAHAEKIDVVIKAEKDAVRLIVQDDGVGFEGTGGIGGGIYNMNRRAEEIGGRLAIRKGESGGTVVTLWSSLSN